ncbi:MAG: iron-only hydrogenase system regulator [Eubacterium sp.]|nr:iron-only hydrogenase system regulator [Eubacterium sp.]
METRTAIIAIIVKDNESSQSINSILHEYSQYIIGRMGIPYHKKDVNIISIAIDAPQDKINTLAGKIGRIEGVTTKTVYSPED